MKALIWIVSILAFGWIAGLLAEPGRVKESERRIKLMREEEERRDQAIREEMEASKPLYTEHARRIKEMEAANPGASPSFLALRYGEIDAMILEESWQSAIHRQAATGRHNKDLYRHWIDGHATSSWRENGGSSKIQEYMSNYSLGVSIGMSKLEKARKKN